MPRFGETWPRTFANGSGATSGVTLRAGLLGGVFVFILVVLRCWELSGMAGRPRSRPLGVDFGPGVGGPEGDRGRPKPSKNIHFCSHPDARHVYEAISLPCLSMAISRLHADARQPVNVVVLWMVILTFSRGCLVGGCSSPDLWVVRGRTRATQTASNSPLASVVFPPRESAALQLWLCRAGP